MQLTRFAGLGLAITGLTLLGLITAYAGAPAPAPQTLYYSSEFGSGIVALTPSTGGSYTPSTFSTNVVLPGQLAFDPQGDLFVPEYYGKNYDGNGDVQEFTRQAGGGYAQSTFTDNLDLPNGLAINTAGALFVIENSDVNGNQAFGDVLEFAPGSHTSTLVAGGLSYANGAAFDPQGDLFVAETSDAAGDAHSGAILEFTPGGGGYTRSTVASGLAGPYGLAVNTQGDVFTTNNVGSNGGSVQEFAPQAGGGYAASTLAGALNRPSGLVVDALGNLFVCNLNGANLDGSDQGGNSGTLLEFTPGAGGAFSQSTVATGLNGPLFLTVAPLTTAAPEPPAFAGLALGVLGLAGLAFNARKRRSSV